MKEEFLHYIWQYKLFSSLKLQTTKQEEVHILKTGTLNTNAGPDFLNAQIIIDNQKWVGNIEIHLKSSDWYVHNHEIDVNYDAVILHVIYEDDVEVFIKNNRALPTLELKGVIDIDFLSNYNKLFLETKKWIPCEKDIASVNPFILSNWFERLYLERLEKKSILIKELLLKSDNDYEFVLFQLLAKNFGLNVNSAAFLNLAKSINFSMIRKEGFKRLQLESLLFGQAGFLEEDVEEVYHKVLKEEYKYQQKKYKIKPIAINQFQFFRMRPHNFPTIRIAQLAALYSQHQNLFSKLITTQKISQIESLFNVEVTEFWKTHYTFEKESKKTPKRITKSFIDLILINTIVPLKFVYEKEKKQTDIDQVLEFVKQLPPEKNTIISKFSDANVKAKDAFESQALLTLKNEYCSPKKCLKCSIGNALLKSTD